MINTKLGMDMNIYIEWEKKLIFLKANKYRKHHKIWKNNIKKLIAWYTTLLLYFNSMYSSCILSNYLSPYDNHFEI